MSDSSQFGRRSEVRHSAPLCYMMMWPYWQSAYFKALACQCRGHLEPQMLCMSLQHLHLLFGATYWQVLLHMAAVVWRQSLHT